MKLYVITDGRNYISSKGGIKSVGSFENAGKWEFEKAKSIKNSIPKTLKFFNWECVLVDNYKIDNCKNTKENKNNSISDENLKVNMSTFEENKNLTANIYERMLDWENYLKQLKEYNKQLKEEYRRLKLEKIDIEHAAEFYDLNMYKGWKLYKCLQDYRKRRRFIKDEILKIEYILDSNFQDCTNNSITNYINSLENRKYRPRTKILEEFFEI